ncbi:MAG: hypothetical protein N2246_02105 [Candidatus Sumerlaeia bacterium]|nr:hypothetical protein [Candidatus Sumerlaeia bacterium]
MTAKRASNLIPVRVTTMEVVIICVIALCVLLLVTNNVETFIRVLYNPISFLVLVVILGEYIILKSADRSRIYKIELEQLRRRQLEYLKVFHRLEQELDKLAGAIANLKDSNLSEPVNSTAADLEKQIRNIKERLHLSV